MAGTNESGRDDINEVLKQIKMELERKKEMRIQMDIRNQLSKLNNTLSSNKAQKEPPKIIIPTAEEIVQTFIKSSPLFGRDFSGWVHETSRLTQANNEQLLEVNKGLARIDSKDNSKDQLDYLDLIADRTSDVYTAVKDTGAELLVRLDSIDTSITKMAEGIVDGETEGRKKQFNEGRTQLKALFDIKDTINSTSGRVVGQLVRLKDTVSHEFSKLGTWLAENAKDHSGDNTPRAGNAPVAEPPEDNGSNGAGLLAGIALMGVLKKVLLAPIKFIGSLVSLFTRFSGLGAMLKGVTKIFRVGPLALITSLIEFGKGFIDAKEILGKAKVTILDRIRAGFTELLGSFGDLVDWVTKIFGFDTNVGKTIRDVWLKISQKPFEWAQAAVDWVKNSLFAGIDLNTSLTDIPGKLADNLQKGLTQLVGWIGDGIVSIFNSTKDYMGEVMDDMKKGFAEHVKKPFFNMLNAITGAMFDRLDTFAELIPDALGGESAREKIKEFREKLHIDTSSNPGDPNPTDPGAELNKTTLPTQPATVSPQAVPQQEPPVVSPQLTPLPPAPSQDPTAGALSLPSPKAADVSLSPAGYGRAAQNTQEIQAASAPDPKVFMPVTQNRNNINNARNTTVLNSQSLQPNNNADIGSSLWSWGNNPM